MKVEVSSEFNPVTITLDSQVELSAVWKAVREQMGTVPAGPGSSALVKLDNALCNLSNTGKIKSISCQSSNKGE